MVIVWLKELYVHIRHILALLSEEQKLESTTKILQILKLGLYSKNEEVAQWACKVIAKLAFELSDDVLSKEAWEWFVAVNGGIFAFFACLEHFPDSVLYIVTALIQVGKDNLVELFTLEMRKVFEKAGEYLKAVSQILNPLTELKLSKDQVKFLI